MPPTWLEVHSRYTWAQLADAFTWSELAAGPVSDEDLREINVDRKVADVFNRLTVGKAVGVLENTLTQFSPFSGANKIAVNQVFALKAVQGSSIFGIFSGFIDFARVVPGVGNRVVEFSASDRSKFFQQTIQTSLSTDVRANSLFALVLNSVGVSTNDYVVDPNIADNIPFAYLDNMSAGEALEQLNRAGSHIMHVDGKGKFRATSRSLEQSATSVTSFENFFSLDFSFSEDTIANDVRISGEPRKVSTEVNTVAFIDDDPVLLAGDSVTFLLEFQDPSNQESTPVQSLVTPVSSQDYRGFTTAAEGGTNITSALGVAITPFATTAEVTVTNSGSVDGFLTHFQLRGNAIQRRPKFLAQAQVSSSQALYGIKGFGLESNLIELVTFAKNYADYIVDLRKDPVEAISIGLKNEFPSMLLLDMLSKTTVVESTVGISGDWTVRGIQDQLSFSRGVEHVRTFTIEKAQSISFFVLDVDLLDEGILGF